MKNKLLTISFLLFTGISVLADSATLPNRDIEILREEIHRHELILAALKEKLAKLEKEVVVERIKIEIDGDGFRFKGDSISENDLKKKISMIPTDTSIMIIAEESTPHRRVVSFLDLLKDHGTTDVVLSTMNSEPDERDNSE